MGELRKVVTNQPIFSSNKIKLVDTGVAVDTSLFERLVSHKLMPKFDQCFSVEDGITPASLREYAQNLLDKEPALEVLRGNPKERRRMLDAFGGIQLPEALAFKLTVSSCKRPDVFEHSVRVALVALFLAIKSYFMSAKELAALAMAAIFHDIGILHVSPDLLLPGRRLVEAERHHLYAHPITGYLVLRDYPELHSDIARAVFEHHERLDGSGYPRGLKKENICLGAQMLMLAEVANTVFECTPKAQSLAKLTVLLKLNHRKFNRKLSNRLIALVGEMQSVPTTGWVNGTLSELQCRVLEVAQIFQDWESAQVTARNNVENEAIIPLLAILDERIADLQRTLLDAGVDTSEPDALLEIMREDPEAMVELDILFGETKWQLAEIIHEAHRRRQDLSEDIGSQQFSVFDWLAQSEERLSLC